MNLTIRVFSIAVFLRCQSIVAFMQLTRAYPDEALRTKIHFNQPLLLRMAGSGDGNGDGERDGDDDLKKTKTLEDLLDTPFFDPDKILDESNDENVDFSPKTWFANLVKNDYVTAEALFVAIYFAVLVVLAQELLRWNLNGGDYVLFSGKQSSWYSNIRF